MLREDEVDSKVPNKKVSLTGDDVGDVLVHTLLHGKYSRSPPGGFQANQVIQMLLLPCLHHSSLTSRLCRGDQLH